MEGLRKELLGFDREVTLLEGFKKAKEITEGKLGKIFLLQLDSQERTVKATGYPNEGLLAAQEKCAEIERANKQFPERQVVLVTVQSLNALPKAYPNFFLDISEFVTLIKKVMET